MNNHNILNLIAQKGIQQAIEKEFEHTYAYFINNCDDPDYTYRFEIVRGCQNKEELFEYILKRNIKLLLPDILIVSKNDITINKYNIKNIDFDKDDNIILSSIYNQNNDIDISEIYDLFCNKKDATNG